MAIPRLEKLTVILRRSEVSLAETVTPAVRRTVVVLVPEAAVLPSFFLASAGIGVIRVIRAIRIIVIFLFIVLSSYHMTSKKKILAVAGVSLILVGLIAMGVKIGQKPKTTSGPVVTPTPIRIEAENKTYQDEAGFSFEYPTGLEIKDVSGNQDVYSILEITAPDKNEKMIIRVVDTKYKTIAEWLKSQNQSGNPVARDFEIGGMTGQQIQLENPRRLVSLVIDKGVMYYFESPLSAEEGQYWNMVHNTIALSFSLGETKPQTGSQTTGGGDNTVYEEGEVVE